MRDSGFLYVHGPHDSLSPEEAIQLAGVVFAPRVRSHLFDILAS